MKRIMAKPKPFAAFCGVVVGSALVPHRSCRNGLQRLYHRLSLMKSDHIPRVQPGWLGALVSSNLLSSSLCASPLCFDPDFLQAPGCSNCVPVIKLFIRNWTLQNVLQNGPSLWSPPLCNELLKGQRLWNEERLKHQRFQTQSHHSLNVTQVHTPLETGWGTPGTPGTPAPGKTFKQFGHLQIST